MPRPLGSKDKNTVFLLNRLKDMYGEKFNPILRAAEQADKLHQLTEESGSVADLKSSVDAWLKIGEFTNHKLRSIELSQNPDNPLFEMSTDDRYTELQRLFQADSSGSGKGDRAPKGTSKPH